MAISKAGLVQIGLCDLGTLATSPVDPVLMGIRAGASLKRSAYKPLKDYLNRSWRNMVNFRVEAETYQSTMFLFSKLVEWINGNVDAQIITKKEACVDTYGNCYKFVGDNKLGLDFEIFGSSDKRTIKVILEAALGFTAAKTFVDGADAATPVDILSKTYKPGDDETYLRRPYYVAFEFPKSTTVLTRDEIMSRSYTIKTKGKKSEESNMSLVDALSFEMVMKFKDATVANQVAIMAKDNSPSLYIKEMNNSTYYDAWDIAAGILTLDDEYENNDDDASITLKFTGDVNICDMTFTFGAAYGGTAGDGGTLGGTLVIA